MSFVKYIIVIEKVNLGCIYKQVYFAQFLQ